MRQRLLGRLAIFWIVIGLCFPECASRADSDATNAMIQAVSGVAETARKIQDKTRYGYDDNISLLGAYLKTDASVTLTKQLKKGDRYALLGSGDEDAQDVDISINDSNNERVAADTDNDPKAVVEFEPKQTGKYTIILKLHKSRKNASFCALAILRKGGWNVPDSNFVDAMAKCIATCSQLGKSRKDLHFHDQPNQWSLFGSVLEMGKETTLPNITMGEGKRIFVAAGDGNALNVDLFLLNKSGNVVEKDDEPDASPIFEYKTSSSSTYSVRIKNVKSKGPSIVISAILAE
jgi:hypothetical protein